MVLSDVSIKRPVLATVMSAVLVIFGAFAYDKLPVREYPDIDAPIVSVSTAYRGASAQIIETQVTQIIEEAVAGIEGIRRIRSTSREESSSVSIEFRLSRNIESASNDVRDRVARSVRRLPSAADAPRIAKVEADARPVIWLTLSSDRVSPLELSDYANRFLVDSFSTALGVASVRLYGERRYAMRVWLTKAALAARGLTVQDVEAAIRRQNVELPSGRIESREREFAVRTASALETPEEFAAIVVKREGDYLVRLGEVARIELAAADERSEFRTNGQGTVGIGVIKQSKSNTLEVANGPCWRWFSSSASSSTTLSWSSRTSTATSSKDYRRCSRACAAPARSALRSSPPRSRSSLCSCPSHSWRATPAGCSASSGYRSPWRSCSRPSSRCR